MQRKALKIPGSSLSESPLVGTLAIIILLFIFTFMFPNTPKIHVRTYTTLKVLGNILHSLALIEFNGTSGSPQWG